MTQYQAILEYLRKHRVATVRDLLRFTNYPSARLHEIERMGSLKKLGSDPISWQPDHRITRTWVQRNGKKVRLYMLTKE